MRRLPRRSNCSRGLLLFSAGCILMSSGLLAAKKAEHSDVTEVVVIEVPVQVTLNGKPVRGLTPENFELFDGRKRQELTGFDLYDLSGAAADSSPMGLRIPAAAQRKFLIFFDLSLSEPDSIVRAREAARELVSTGLDPTDLVGVATWSVSSGPNLILGFTSDRRQAEIAIDSLGLSEIAHAQRDPLDISLVPLPEPWGQPLFDHLYQERPLPLGAFSGGTAMATQLKEIQAQSRQSDVKMVVSALTQSLTRVAEQLRSVEGRKYVVFFSEGFDSSIVVGQGGGSTYEEQQAIQRQNNAAIYGTYQDVDSSLRFGDTSAQNELGRVLQELVRADCVIQAVDIGGVRAVTDTRALQQNKQGLFLLADGTGGELYENFNNLSEVMGRMLERTSVTYVLAFQAEDLKLDGAFHKLKVKLAGGPTEARLVHRPGYFAPRPYAELSPQERGLSAASSLFGEPGGELRVATLAAPFEIASQPAHVPSLIEIDGADLLKGAEGGQVTAEIYAYAIAANGEVRDYYSQIIGIDLEKAGPALQQKGLKFWSRFEVPPGDYVARVLVRNAVTGASGVAVSPFRVPDAGRQEPVLLPPFFPEAAGQWLDVRGERAEGSTHDYPFTIQGQAFVPAVRPILVPGKSAPVLLAGYGLRNSTEIRGELMTLRGEPVQGVFLNVGEGRPGEEPGMVQWAATLSFGALEPGDYLLLVTATEPESGETYSSSITVSVAG